MTGADTRYGAGETMDPTTSYSVLLRDPLRVAPLVAAQAVAQATGRVALDVTREIRDRVGFLASGLNRPDADRVVGGLARAGIRAFALSDAELVEFPDPVFMESARPGEGALEVSALRGPGERRIGGVRVPYNDIVFLATAFIRTPVETVEPEAWLDGAPPVQVVDGPLGPHLKFDWSSEGSVGAAPRKVTDFRQDHLLDLFAVEPAHHLRLKTSAFKFAQTGLRMQPTSVANLVEFVRVLLPLCGEATADPSIPWILDNDPLTGLRFSAEDQYDSYLRWRIQLLYHPE